MHPTFFALAIDVMQQCDATSKVGAVGECGSRKGAGDLPTLKIK
jgi:hypothetical protein